MQQKKENIMFAWLKRLAEKLNEKRNYEEEYLSKSVDIYDLEARMRSLERKRQLESSYWNRRGSL